jgi:acetoacetyl-CoA synthetase
MDRNSVEEGSILWEPSNDFMEQSNIVQYMNWIRDKKGLDFQNYDALWKWSVTKIEDFWESLWEFFEIKASKPYTRVLSERKMPGAKWFIDTELNYAEHVFRNMYSDHPALIFKSESRPQTEITWEELYNKVSSVAATLRTMGIKRGDRIVAYMPNIPETIIAFLASASIGVTWSSCSPDFGTRSVIDRFKQIEPKVLFAVDGYMYGGKEFDCRTAISELQRSLDNLKSTVLIPYLNGDTKPGDLKDVKMWDELLHEKSDLVFEQVPFSHPLWILYSSGTTGLPKAIVHSQGGILIELLKCLGMHVDLKPGDRFFWFTTTGWMMWNFLQGGMLLGATPILYDGNPGYPDMNVLWELAETTSMTVFGTGAPFLTACMKAGLEPGSTYDLSSLKSIGSTGAPLPPEGFQWVYEKVKSDLLLFSTSGGTDVCTAFLGGCPLLPVHAGELPCRCLGARVEAFDEGGTSVVNEVGELVLTGPMPSMPLFFWNDPENQRYIESYFDMYPGIWRHGDWIRITKRGSAVITGRSDSTLKRMGVRMGSSDFYSAIEDLPEVLDSLIVGFDVPGGGYYMPLFVVLDEGAELDDTLKKKINTKIRSSLSPRHLPDDIFSVSDIPKTLNNKKLEVPVKKILMGVPVEQAVNFDSMSNPKSIEYFVDIAKKLKSRLPAYSSKGGPK